MKRSLERDPVGGAQTITAAPHFPCSCPRVLTFECCLPQSSREELRSSGRVPSAELH